MARSLRMVEEQDSQFYTMTFGVWLCTMGLVEAGAFVLSYTQRPEHANVG